MNKWKMIGMVFNSHVVLQGQTTIVKLVNSCNKLKGGKSRCNHIIKNNLIIYILITVKWPMRFNFTILCYVDNRIVKLCFGIEQKILNSLWINIEPVWGSLQKIIYYYIHMETKSKLVNLFIIYKNTCPYLGTNRNPIPHI